jgi:hypothetical protein
MFLSDLDPTRFKLKEIVMKLVKCALSFAVYSSAILFTQSAAAYQLTYTTNPLLFLQGYLGGEPDGYVGSYDPPFPSLSVTFDNIADQTPTQNLTGTGFTSIRDWPTLAEDLPVSNGSLTLGTDGIPTAWNFSLQLTRSIPGVRDLELDENGETIYFNEFSLPSKTSWLFESSYGAGTCNCDTYKYEVDSYIERPYYSWAYANTLGFLYGGEGSPSNWSVSKVDVPEPKTYLLFALGLIVMCVRKMRRKNFI